MADEGEGDVAGGSRVVFGDDLDNNDPYDEYMEIKVGSGSDSSPLNVSALTAGVEDVGLRGDEQAPGAEDGVVPESPESSSAAEVTKSAEHKTLERRVSKADETEADEALQARKKSQANLGPVRDHSEEDVHHPNWICHRKHVFILSEAGKPIYSRYGNEDKLATIMGVMQALVSFVQDDKDTLRWMIAGDHKFVFICKHHMVLVTVANSGESPQQLALQLNYTCSQILSVLTLSQLNRIFQQRRNYDLRRLLSGTEKFIDNLWNLMDEEPSFILGAVRCLPLPSSVRDTIGHILQGARVPELVFALLVVDNQLVTLLRPKRYSLHPSDLHLIFNLVDASMSFRTGESWMPICLPKFDNAGYLHAHVSYIEDEESTVEAPGIQLKSGASTSVPPQSFGACLLLLSTDRNAFFALSKCRATVEQKMLKHNCIKAIAEAVGRRAAYRIAQTDISDLLHFMYKSKVTHQYTSPRLEAPYMTPADRQRLIALYQYLHHRMHSQARPLRIIYHVTQQEAVLGWITSHFELYATFSPLVTKPVAISALNKLLRWIKHEEDRLFILNPQMY
ncbi:protein SAND-like [Sycon ciliatum]|uniref:protein SAND-like n=1 Tax=Sycon ciliatum TaxID=27933 RepID=UPI0031F6C61B